MTVAMFSHWETVNTTVEDLRVSLPNGNVRMKTSVPFTEFI